MIYLDNASTTKVDESVLAETIKYHINDYANASSRHHFGQRINKVVEKSKEQVARLINSENNEIYFTSGATESINMILKGFVESNIDRGNHLITTAVEHKASLETCKYLESIGIEITYLNVDSNGLINLKELKSAIKPDTLLVSVLWVNNETGVIQDLSSIGKITKDNDIKLFIDASQAVGKIDVDVKKLNIDMLCFSAHKFHGPKGIGVSYIRKDLLNSPLIHGGGQQSGLRSGTLNVPAIVGLGESCRISLNTDIEQIESLRNYFENTILENFDCEIIGANSKRSPYISNVIFMDTDSEVIINKLKNVVVSTGSACTSQINEPSHVLTNMGIENHKAFGSIRFSFSKFTTFEEIEMAVNELKSIF